MTTEVCLMGQCSAEISVARTWEGRSLEITHHSEHRKRKSFGNRDRSAWPVPTCLHRRHREAEKGETVLQRSEGTEERIGLNIFGGTTSALPACESAQDSLTLSLSFRVLVSSREVRMTRALESC